MIDLTGIINAILALIAAIITYKLVPFIKAKTTEQQRNTMSAIVHTLVFAAEQIYGSGFGAEKLQYVEQELEKRGYAVDRSEIEAAVRSTNVFKISTDTKKVEEALDEKPHD